MTEEEHIILLKDLKDKWVGRTFIFADGSEEPFTIMDVYVDYRPERQDMNRVVDDWGNIWFIFELEDANFLTEIVK